MSLDRANYYPLANRKVQDFSGSGPMPAPDKVVWHSTEGLGWSGYDGGSIAPHLTVAPDWTAKRLIWRQHFPFSQFGKSLVNKAGGVETNRDACIQVEIVGTCDPGTHRKWSAKHLFMPELPDWAVEDLAAFTLWCTQHHGIPLSGPSLWLAYGKDSRAPGRVPASYGNSPARLTFAQWRKFTGHCGHQHVPESVHGDPGAFPITDIIAAARRQENEDDMPNLDEFRKVVREEVISVLTTEKLVENRKQEWETEQLPPMTVVSALSNIEKDTDHAPATPAAKPVTPTAK